MNEIMNDRVRVQILGKEYEMDPGNLTPLEVQSLATFVDEKMKDLSTRFNIVDTQKIAVLACLNIALDYLQLREKGHPHQTIDINPKLEELSRMLDQALDAD